MAALKEEVESAEKRMVQAQFAYNELQAYQSDSRKLQEKIDSLVEEQNRRYAESQSNLWNFKFEHASSAQQQQMARKSFFEAQNRLEGARSNDQTAFPILYRPENGRCNPRCREKPPDAARRRTRCRTPRRRSDFAKSKYLSIQATDGVKEFSASNFIASGEKIVPLPYGAEKRPYPHRRQEPDFCTAASHNRTVVKNKATLCPIQRNAPLSAVPGLLGRLVHWAGALRLALGSVFCISCEFARRLE
jgi:hypothetical protein